jgi:hypothetical protein
MNQSTTAYCRQMSLIHATNMDTHGKPNTNLATTTFTTTKQSATLDKLQKNAKKKAFELIEDLQRLDMQSSNVASFG